MVSEKVFDTVHFLPVILNFNMFIKWLTLSFVAVDDPVVLITAPAYTTLDVGTYCVN